jgi:hypothetical protein
MTVETFIALFWLLCKEMAIGNIINKNGKKHRRRVLNQHFHQTGFKPYLRLAISSKVVSFLTYSSSGQKIIDYNKRPENIDTRHTHTHNA